jgi:diguanylate cyclase (GGDEF)-like protein
MSIVRSTTIAARASVVTAGALVTGTVLLLPFCTIELGATLSFMPALIAMVTCFDIMSVVLLLGGYRDQGDRRLLLMAAAYAWSMVVMLGYALAFPGAIAQAPPLATTASTAPYLYVMWHGGFPLVLGLASAPWPERFTARTRPERRSRAALRVIMTAAVSALATVALVVTQSTRLPDLIVGLDTSRMTSFTAPLILPAVLVALVVSYVGSRGRGGPQRWCTVLILVCSCDLVLTYSSRERFSLGWYSGRMLTLVAAGTVVVAMLGSFRRLSARAEHDAAHDALTGLANRRTAYARLEQMIALARRSGRPLGVVSLDLDHFKQINDRYGHGVGDEVLRAAAQRLLATCRVSDVVARVGGEEFVVLLPDTDRAGTADLAEKLRRAVASLELLTLRHPLSASLGATTLTGADTSTEVLRRADNALYEAKRGGRNRVVEARSGPSSTAWTDGADRLVATSLA